MSIVLVIWKAHLRSAYSSLRQDTRRKIAWFIALTVDLVVGLWFTGQLIDRLSQWQAAGTPILEARLWLLCSGAWGTIAFFTILSTVTVGFANDQPLLLLTLPIPPAARFRALYGLVFIEGIGNWLLLESIVIGIPLVRILRWQALAWLVLLLLGVAVIVWISVLVTLLTIRYVLPHLRRTLLIMLSGSVGLVIVYMVIRSARLTLPAPWSLSLPVPGLVNLLYVILLVFVIGPFAGSTGQLYLEAFYKMEGRSGSHSVLNFPGVRSLGKLLEQYRTLTGALLLKGLLNQSRNAFTWMRLVVILVCVAIFPFIHTLVAPYQLLNIQLVVFYSSSVAILAIIEYAPYAISGEGSRLSLYLVTPTGITRYLRARLIAFLAPVLLAGLALSLLLSIWISLPVIESWQAILIVTLVLIGFTSFVVWGSAWDEDLNFTAEGRMQTLLQEELPITPRRLQLLGLSLLFLATMFLLVWKLPALVSMPMLILLDGIVIAVGWRFSHAHLQRMLIRG
jgi:hypothetical protein